MQHGADHRERNGSNRQIDVEDPAPGEVVDEEPTEQRPGNARDREDGSDVALVAAAFARRDDVADDRQSADHQAAGAESLQRAESNQLEHALRLPAQGGADHEEHDRELEQALASVEIAELAVQRHRDGRGEDVGDDHPGVVVETAEVADDGR